MPRVVPSLLFCASIAIVASLVALAAPGCEASDNASLCKEVPAGGCPLSYGHACDDPLCEAAYACNPDGTWTLDHVCPARDAAADDASSPDANDSADALGASDAPPFDALAIDAAGASGGPGCIALEPPECPLATALACPKGCCDCEDLFVCDDGGWSPWGTCDDAGVRAH
jgi:hypothetical protein